MSNRNERAEAIAILKGSNRLSASTRQRLSDELILGIIAAEDAEMHSYERVRGGLGPGQMFEGAHKDVTTTLGDELQRYITGVNARLSAEGSGAVTMGRSSATDVKEATLSTFFIAGYLAISIDRAQKPGRSASDALRYGIAYFHGARSIVHEALKKIDVQKVVNDAPIPWSAVEQTLERSGGSKERDLLKYVRTVLAGGRTK